MAIVTDTYAAIRSLEAAGADSNLAEAIVQTVGRADRDLATKSDLKAELSVLEVRLTSAGYHLACGVVVANTAIVFGLLKVLLPG